MNKIIEKLNSETKNISLNELVTVNREIRNYIKSLEKKMKFKASTSIKDFLIARR